MESDDDYVKALLERTASEAGPLRATLPVLDHAIHRRRTAVVVGAVAFSAAATVATITLVSTMWLTPMNADPGAGSGTSRKPTTADRHPAPGTSTSVPVQWAHSLSCGGALTQPLTTKATHGLTLSITSVKASRPGQPPDVTVALSASAAVAFTQPGVTPLQLLLMKGDVIIDRFASWPLAPGTGSTDWIALHDGTKEHPALPGIGYRWQVTPGAPHLVTVTGPGLCPSVPWTSAWNQPTGYSLVAVMSVPRPDNEMVPPSAAADPLLVSKAVPLTPR